MVAAMLWRLPLMVDIMTTRDARILARNPTRRSRKKALCPQILDVNIRDYALEVDKNQRKCIIYIQEQETLQFLVDQLFKDLQDGQVASKPRPTNYDRHHNRLDSVIQEQVETHIARLKQHGCRWRSMSPSRLRVKKDGAWNWVSLKGLAKRIRLGDADGCSQLVEGCVDSFLVQLEDPVADAALEDEPEEDQKEAATIAELPNEAFD